MIIIPLCLLLLEDLLSIVQLHNLQKFVEGGNVGIFCSIHSG